MTRFAVFFCLLRFPFTPFKKVGVQRVRSPWGLRAAGLSAVEWVGGPGERGVAVSRAGSQFGARHAAGSRDPGLSRVAV